MKPYIIPGLILIILVLCFVSLRQCEKAKELVSADDKTELLQEVAENRARIAQQDSAIQRVIKNRITDSLKFATSINDLNASRDYWKGKALKARPQIVVMADSVPVLKEYLVATDSVIETQHAIINSMGMRMRAMEVSYKIEIDALGAKNIQQIALTETWKTAAVEREKDLKKANRRRRFWRSVSVVLAATTAVLVLSN